MSTWAKVKAEVTQLSNTFRLSDVVGLMGDIIDKGDEEEWISCVQHAEQLQEVLHKQTAHD
jgi:hypothetical protein